MWREIKPAVLSLLPKSSIAKFTEPSKFKVKVTIFNDEHSAS